ncbi:GTPase Era, partial [Brevundimonas sp.]|uniref:GTPase Era n=2 Tax=Brevundimonas TaxID=41275 RepID=UPI0028B0AF7C
MTETLNPNQRAGFAAIIGAPNAGKSTLVNRLTGSKVSIVTQKVQTTRFPVRGIAIEGDAQIVLVDTPGIFTPRRRLDRAMVASAWGGAEDADVVVHLIDAPSHIASEGRDGTAADRKSAEDTETIIANLKATGTKVILVLNKIDGMRRDTLLALSHRLFETGVYEEVYMISALSGDGVDDLKQRLARSMPAGPWLYPEDQSADVPVRVLAAEITREKVYLRVHEELPYSAAVETTAFDEKPDGSVRIEQTIYVERES